LWILLIGLWGCLTEPDCFDTTTNSVGLGFYDEDDETVNVLVDSIGITGLTSYLIPEDSLSTFQLPIDPAQNSAEITFFLGNQTERLLLSYDQEIQVVSDNCGTLTYFINLQLVETTFDTVTIANPRLSTNAGINVKISLE
jgi:hypothetical protein